MRLKLLIKYLLLYLPFVVGIGCYAFGMINLVSSMLLFLGGYVALKNTFDYRKVRGNIQSKKVIKNDCCSIETKVDLNNNLGRQVIKTKNIDNIVGLKRVRRYSRVRRRY